MKTKLFLMIMAVAAVIITLSSCEKEPLEPAIIGSEVLDGGLSSVVDEKIVNNPNGGTTTGFSYESWILLNVQTRATYEQKVSAVVNVSIADTVSAIAVDHLQIGECKNSISRESRKSRLDKNVLIVDSVLVYTVAFEKFSFCYELVYEVPVYSEGVTTQPMPYHRIEFLEDKGYSVEYAEPEFDGLKIYACRLLKHSIRVSFNDKQYDVYAIIKLRKLMATDGKPVVVYTEVLEGGKEVITCDGNNRMPVFIYNSWVKMKHIWSDGTKNEVVYKQRGNPSIYIVEENLQYKVLPNINLKLNSTSIKDDDMQIIGGDNQYTALYTYDRRFVIEYNYFSLTAKMKEPIPVYDDGLIVHKMPHYVFGNMSYSAVLSDPTDDRVDAKEAYCYDLRPEISISFEDKNLKLKDMMWLYVIK